MESPENIAKKDGWESNEDVECLREYLRIPSVHPGVDYAPCIEFLKRQADGMELPYQIFYPANEENPVFVITWVGTDPKMSAILINSHMDVVPVYEEYWDHPPFGADMDESGNIYARGAQDMKSVGIQQLAAIRALKKSGARFKRTIHLSFVPDEEKGGKLGMQPFVKSQEFKDLNIGFSLDEGGPTPDDVFVVFYAERSMRQMTFKFSGASGHGSTLLRDTAGEKLNFIVSRMMEKRKREQYNLESNPDLFLGDVTTINLTCLSGGVQTNVVPPLLTATFDVRLSMKEDHEEFDKQIARWCEQAGSGIEIEYEEKQPKIPATAIDESNLFWMAFKSAVDNLDIQIKTLVCPGGSDGRFIRQIGIPCLGFSPINNTRALLHTDNEYINADTFVRGIEILKVIIPKLANATKCYCAYAREEE